MIVLILICVGLLILVAMFRAELRTAFGGRETATKGIVAIVLMLMLGAGGMQFYQQSLVPQPQPGPQPAPVPVPVPPPIPTVDMSGVFLGEHAARDAAAAAEFFRELVALLEFDGLQIPPLISHDCRYEDAREVFVRYYGRNFETPRPEFTTRVSAYLLQTLGEDDQAMTPERRKQWQEALNALATGCDQAVQ